MSEERHPLDTPVGPNGESRERMILLAIRAGAFAHVAAEAADLPARVFDRYLRAGRRAGAPPRLRRFARLVRQAVAQARLKVEMEMREDDPKFWLCHGPGRETRTRVGWTTATKPLFDAAGPESNPLDSPEFREWLSQLLELLTPFPDLRAAASALHEQLQARAARRRPSHEKSPPSP
jgi:hypothetical protein